MLVQLKCTNANLREGEYFIKQKAVEKQYVEDNNFSSSCL